MPHLAQLVALAAAAAASLAAAQTPTTTQLYLVGVDANSPFEASVVAVAGPTTTFAVHCAPGTDSSDCGINDARVTLAPDAYDIRDSLGSAQYAQHCSVANGVPTACTGAGAGDVGSPVPVAIVAGADKLAAAASPSPTAAPSAAAGSSGSGSAGSSGGASTSTGTMASASASTGGSAGTPSAAAGASVSAAMGALVGVAGVVVAVL